MVTEERKAAMRAYYAATRGARLAKKKEYRDVNKEAIAESKKAHREANLEVYKKKDSEYHARPDVKERVSERNRARWKTDEQFRIGLQSRNSVNNALRRNLNDERVLRLPGCSLGKLKQHLSSKFQEGMTWGNWGNWHIDHIVPLVKFDLTCEAELLAAFNWSNLQPLWAEDNMKKGDKN